MPRDPRQSGSAELPSVPPLTVRRLIQLRRPARARQSNYQYRQACCGLIDSPACERRHKYANVRANAWNCADTIHVPNLTAPIGTIAVSWPRINHGSKRKTV